MSDAFSFLFALYGLLLGLAFAEIASGFSRAYDQRKLRPLGVIAPLFAVLLLLDLITFWLAAWEFREARTVDFPTAVGAAAIALLYFFAATQVFPKEGDSDTLTTHILQQRRTVVFCVIVSNILSVSPVLATGIREGMPPLMLAAWGGVNLAYYAALTVAALARSKPVIITTLVLLIIYVAGASTFLA